MSYHTRLTSSHSSSLVPRDRRAQRRRRDGAPRGFAGGDAEERQTRRPSRSVFFSAQRDEPRAGGASQKQAQTLHDVPEHEPRVQRAHLALDGVTFVFEPASFLRLRARRRRQRAALAQLVELAARDRAYGGRHKEFRADARDRGAGRGDGHADTLRHTRLTPLPRQSFTLSRRRARDVLQELRRDARRYEFCFQREATHRELLDGASRRDHDAVAHEQPEGAPQRLLPLELR
mmetsp:Transcript_12313/g.51518  ORF Transcript_12313/g.51518 Transcript_12313/m.51518 type:complete len:233 (+) Transcript_12313:88-786(+)